MTRKYPTAPTMATCRTRTIQNTILNDTFWVLWRNWRWPRIAPGQPPRNASRCKVCSGCDALRWRLAPCPARRQRRWPDSSREPDSSKAQWQYSWCFPFPGEGDPGQANRIEFPGEIASLPPTPQPDRIIRLLRHHADNGWSERTGSRANQGYSSSCPSSHSCLPYCNGTGACGRPSVVFVTMSWDGGANQP